MEIFILKHPVVGKLNLFSGMQNDASMHREGLQAYKNHFTSLKTYLMVSQLRVLECKFR